MAGNTFLQKIKVQLDGANKASKGAGRVSASMKKMALAATGAATAFFGARMLIDGLKQSIQLSTKAEALSLPFERLNKVMGGSTGALQKYTKAVDGTINEVELMRMANQAMTLGVVDSDDAMAELFDTAQRLGKSLGVDTRQAIDSLVTGMGRQSMLMLDNLGIIVDSNQAYKDYAVSIGTTVSKLTDQEKKLAFNNAALDSAKEKVAALGAEQLGTSEAMAQVSVSVDSLLISIGQALSPVIVNMAEFFNNATNSVTAFFTSFTETDLERTIRQLRELGADTLDYEIELKKQTLEEAKANVKTHETVNLLMRARKRHQNTLEEYIRLMHIKKKQDDLEKEGAYEGIIVTDEMIKKREEESKKLEQNNAKAKLEIEFIDQQIKAKSILKNEQMEYNLLLEAQAKRNGQILEQMQFTNIELDKSNAHNFIKKQLVKDEFQEVNPLINIMTESYNDFRLSMDKANKASIDGAMAIGAAQSHAGQAAADAAGVYITAEIQKALSTMILKAFGELGFFGGLGAVATAGAAGSLMAQTIKSVTAAEGFEGIVDEPTMFLAGEEGPEYVDIEPTMNEGAGRGGANITITGNVLSRDFIEDEAVPMIREALRKGGDIGIG